MLEMNLAVCWVEWGETGGHRFAGSLKVKVRGAGCDLGVSAGWFRETLWKEVSTGGSRLAGGRGKGTLKALWPCCWVTAQRSRRGRPATVKVERDFWGVSGRQHSSRECLCERVHARVHLCISHCRVTQAG